MRDKKGNHWILETLASFFMALFPLSIWADWSILDTFWSRSILEMCFQRCDFNVDLPGKERKRKKVALKSFIRPLKVLFIVLILLNWNWMRILNDYYFPLFNKTENSGKWKSSQLKSFVFIAVVHLTSHRKKNRKNSFITDKRRHIEAHTHTGTRDTYIHSLSHLTIKKFVVFGFRCWLHSKTRKKNKTWKTSRSEVTRHARLVHTKCIHSQLSHETTVNNKYDTTSTKLIISFAADSVFLIHLIKYSDYEI